MRGRNLDHPMISGADNNRQLFNAQLDTIMERLPDPDIPITELDDESKAWIDDYKIVDTLGIDGQSSDESDGDEDGIM